MYCILQKAKYIMKSYKYVKIKPFTKEMKNLLLLSIHTIEHETICVYTCPLSISKGQILNMLPRWIL